MLKLILGTPMVAAFAAQAGVTIYGAGRVLREWAAGTADDGK